MPDCKPPPRASLAAETLRVGYSGKAIIDDLTLAVPDAGFTALIGPNGSGKSTLLRALSRTLAPDHGAVLLDGRAISSMPSKEIARKIGTLPQAPSAPEGLSVKDLVQQGRYPHRTLFGRWSDADSAACAEALRLTGMEHLAERPLDSLSGGQKQRAWIAMTLAQQTGLLLLDEPTTYLDIAHQIELLDLLVDLNAQSRTIVAVLHDLNHACRYASHIVAMKDGAVVAQGKPDEIVTEDLIGDVFGLPCMIVRDPVSGTPMVVPRKRRRAGAAA